jgi:hypothetical protein
MVQEVLRWLAFNRVYGRDSTYGEDGGTPILVFSQVAILAYYLQTVDLAM